MSDPKDKRLGADVPDSWLKSPTILGSENNKYDVLFKAAADRQGLDPALFKAVNQKESGVELHTKTIGRDGEYGLGQVKEDKADVTKEAARWHQHNDREKVFDTSLVMARSKRLTDEKLRSHLESRVKGFDEKERALLKEGKQLTREQKAQKTAWKDALQAVKNADDRSDARAKLTELKRKETFGKIQARHVLEGKLRKAGDGRLTVYGQIKLSAREMARHKGVMNGNELKGTLRYKMGSFNKGKWDKWAAKESTSVDAIAKKHSGQLRKDLINRAKFIEEHRKLNTPIKQNPDGYVAVGRGEKGKGSVSNPDVFFRIKDPKTGERCYFDRDSGRLYRSLEEALKEKRGARRGEVKIGEGKDPEEAKQRLQDKVKEEKLLKEGGGKETKPPKKSELREGEGHPTPERDTRESPRRVEAPEGGEKQGASELREAGTQPEASRISETAEISQQELKELKQSFGQADFIGPEELSEGITVEEADKELGAEAGSAMKQETEASLEESPETPVSAESDQGGAYLETGTLTSADLQEIKNAVAPQEGAPASAEAEYIRSPESYPAGQKMFDDSQKEGNQQPDSATGAESERGGELTPAEANEIKDSVAPQEGAPASGETQSFYSAITG